MSTLPPVPHGTSPNACGERGQGQGSAAQVQVQRQRHSAWKAWKHAPTRYPNTPTDTKKKVIMTMAQLTALRICTTCEAEKQHARTRPVDQGHARPRPGAAGRPAQGPGRGCAPGQVAITPRTCHRCRSSRAGAAPGSGPAYAALPPLARLLPSLALGSFRVEALLALGAARNWLSPKPGGASATVSIISISCSQFGVVVCVL